MKISDMQMSALAEAGNVGSGHAAIALSQLMGRKIMIDVPLIDFTKFDAIGAFVGNGHKRYAQVSVPLFGDICGAMVFVIEYSMALRLCKIIMNGGAKDHAEMGEVELSAIKETGSILSISYLNAVSEMTGLSLIASVPELALGEIKELPRLASLHNSSLKDIGEVLCIKTEFMEAGGKIDAFQFFIAGVADTEKLILSLGV